MRTTIHFLSFAALLGLLVSLIPMAHAADVYAEALDQYTPTNLYTPEKALGAPDGAYAEFWADEVSLTLDMGKEVAGNAVLSLNPMSVGARVRVTFLNADKASLDTFEDYLPQTSGPWTAIYEGTGNYRYVFIESLEDKDWALDAVAATAVEEEDPVEEEPAEEPEEEPIEDVVGGDLVKTANSPSVYLIGSDGKRHAFPNQTVFASWGYDFGDVTTITPEDMAAYTLGSNVTVKPGTYLVKVTTVPKVYAVAPDAELRWIVDEETAIDLYGLDWAKKVIDVADVFWKNYTVGEEIDEESDLNGWEISEHRY